MGFLSKKTMLVSLVALLLAACTSGSNPPSPTATATNTPIDLPCNGPVKDHTVTKTKQTLSFQTSGCKLIDVTFQTEDSGNFTTKKHNAVTSGDVGFDYDGGALPAAGAYFYYRTDGSSTDGGGGGIIKSQN